MKNRVSQEVDHVSDKLNINMLINAINGLMNVLFPLISFPYVSRVLGVANIGRYNWASTFVSYFITLASLGINGYAIREGTPIRENKKKFELFCSEVFTINMLSAMFSYLILVLFVLFSKKALANVDLIMVFSVQILMTCIGVEWIFSIEEDFLSLAIRNLITKFLAIIAMIILVRDSRDTNKYAIVYTVSFAIGSIINFIKSQKYTLLRFRNSGIKHWKPILVIFAVNASIAIYVSIDTTILGLICDDWNVGIYSTSVKIYTVIKTVLSSMLVVGIPGIASEFKKENRDGMSLASANVVGMVYSVMIPVVLMIIFFRNEIILLIAGRDYMSADTSLMILCVALIFSIGASFAGQCVLISVHQEKIVLIVSVLCVAINVALNLIFIPIYKENAAAMTTLISEFVSCMILGRFALRYISMDLKHALKLLLKIAFGLSAVFMVIYLITSRFGGTAGMVISLVVSIVVYLFVESLTNNMYLKKFMHLAKHRGKSYQRRGK